MIVDQVYEGFTVELKDLKLSKQEKIIKQVNDAIECIDTQVWYKCLYDMLTLIFGYIWLWNYAKEYQVFRINIGACD